MVMECPHGFDPAACFTCTPTTALEAGFDQEDDRNEAVWRALLYVLQMPDAEARKLRPLAPDTFIRALEQDGWTVTPK